MHVSCLRLRRHFQVSSSEDEEGTLSFNTGNQAASAGTESSGGLRTPVSDASMQIPHSRSLGPIPLPAGP